MADYNIAFQKLLQDEGGYVSNKNDPGGATNFGISLKYLASQKLIDGDFDHDGDIDSDDVKVMPISSAQELYRKDFWDNNRIGDIKSQRLANMVLGLCVNMGSPRAIKLLQNTVNELIEKPISVDGVIGHQTIFYTNNLMEQNFIKAFLSNAMAFYQELIDRNPKLSQFRDGWIRRLWSYVY